MTPMLNSIVLGIGASSLRAGTPAVINKCVNPGEIAYTVRPDVRSTRD